MAGFVPGLLLAVLFMMTVVVACTFRRAWGGTPIETSWALRRKSLVHLLPPLGIFLVVVGSIYAGLATPTEAASLGVVASLGLAAFARSLSIEMLRRTLEGTMRTTAMVMLIILAAIFLNFVLAAIGLTQALSQFILELGLTPMQTLLAVIAFYLVLGCFMETLSMLLTTTPLIVPIIVELGFDPVWFGILMMVMLENGAHHSADRGEPLRRAECAGTGLDERRHRRHASLRRHHVRHDRAAGHLPGTRALAAGDVLLRAANHVADGNDSRSPFPGLRRCPANIDVTRTGTVRDRLRHHRTQARRPCSFSARKTFSGVNGISSMRTPTASKIALAMAGMGGVEHISPTPLPP